VEQVRVGKALRKELADRIFGSLEELEKALLIGPIQKAKAPPLREAGLGQPA